MKFFLATPCFSTQLRPKIKIFSGEKFFLVSFAKNPSSINKKQKKIKKKAFNRELKAFLVLRKTLCSSRGSNPKKIGFLDWIWMGNPNPNPNPKIQKIQNSNPNPNPKIHFFLDFKKSKFEENDFF